MNRIVQINLENELDLILAHKRTMKLLELCGMSLIVQTSFATAVSEIARCVIGTESHSVLTLGINNLKLNRKELEASIVSSKDFTADNGIAMKYAARLASDVKIIAGKPETEVILKQGIQFSGLINDARIDSFVEYFKKELPLSPYDELRKKNIQLIELAEKLRESEIQYRGLAETLPLMIFTTNPTGTVTYANKWLKDFFGIPDSELYKHPWLGFLHGADKDKRIRDLWNNAQTSQLLLRTEAKLRTNVHDDEALWHLISLYPVRNEHNKLTGWTGFFADIHAQKMIEETLKNNVALKAAQKQLLNYQARLEEKILELNKSNHDLEQFAYIASHDLQEPLRKIRSFTELLENNFSDPEKRKKYLTKIDESSERMTSLIRDVLNYSRLTKTETIFTQVNLEEILNAVKTDMELLIEEKQVKIQASGLGTIMGIRQQLFQLFYNLIGNSIKFSDKCPEITLSSRELSYEEIREHPDLHISLKYIELSFKDKGIGFDQKYARQIFTIFNRLNPQSAYSGTGIGLALCKKITDNHHGTISVESAPGQGAEFKVVLPVE